MLHRVQQRLEDTILQSLATGNLSASLLCSSVPGICVLSFQDGVHLHLYLRPSSSLPTLSYQGLCAVQCRILDRVALEIHGESQRGHHCSGSALPPLLLLLLLLAQAVPH